ncbi:MAG TPA: hypothetical protein VM165_14175 [Planctomycetaceae bacterium]|nr:hypothetical protein [Planctomycetaceae bacterium]
MKHLKAFAFVILCCAIGCAGAYAVPRVITLVSPHVSILPLDVSRNPGLDGRVLCDLQGYPVIYVRMGLPPIHTRYIVVHEAVHAQQAFAHPNGCVGLRDEMSRDSMFRLTMEAAAFCNVANAQREMGDDQDPDRAEIFKLLSERYGADYDSVAAERSMVLCGG